MKRWQKRAITIVVVLGVMAALWVWAFPWIDRTFVNRPAVERGMAVATRLSV